ncbi:SEC12-like protein 1 [Olea europaea subsp. europaea]|uniref:SEC12-like protein 1 n=1 Tax=Olea europaea subsp. europaea TaxID=158383 RepID=A0A8S0SR74_OLEEU|nr:SEC12-like protein 1 [Olea europaea subsp. europaea]
MDGGDASGKGTATYEFEEEVNPVTIAVHPSGDDVVCSTDTGGCKLFEVYGREDYVKLTTKELPPLQSVGLQKCLAFSVDGTRFATGGVDGYLRIFEWPSMQVILDEPTAHKSFQDVDFRIWKTNNGAPVTTLARNSDEKIELCRFSKDGTNSYFALFKEEIIRLLVFGI